MCAVTMPLQLIHRVHLRRREDSNGVTIGGTRINNLRYADDIVLVADSEENLQNMIDKVKEVGKLK